MIKLINILKEDWYDDYINYAYSIIEELRKRFNINSSQQEDLIDYFGDDIERGYKKNLDPSQVALEMVPQDRSITLWKENKK
tara:strand:- start:92 stop:337 length:246 start_codon:yes stop_codon:yes gene_type:complete